MNLSEIFIRRPIATSLLMAAHRAVRRRRVSRAAGQRSAAGRLPDAERQRRPARRRSGHDGVVGRQPARAAVHDDRRPRLDDLVAAASGSTNVTLQFDLDRDIDSADGRRADGDRRGDAAAAGRHAVAAVVPQEQPGRPADPDAQPDVEHAADVGARRLRRDDDRAAHLDGQRRVAGAGAGRVEVRGARADRSRQAARAAASASTKSIRRCRTGTSTCRPASCSARRRPTTSRPPAS